MWVNKGSSFPFKFVAVTLIRFLSLGMLVVCISGNIRFTERQIIYSTFYHTLIIQNMDR